VLFASCVESRVPTAILERDSAGISIVESVAPAWPTGAEWSVSPDPVVTIGAASGAEAEQLYRVRGVARLANGDVALVNGGTHDVRIYSPTGAYVRRFGREGHGPGEFRFPNRLWRLPADSLAIADLDKISTFDSTGALVYSDPLAGSPIGRYTDGDVVRLPFAAGQNLFELGYARPRLAVVRARPDGSRADTLAVVAGDEVYRIDVGTGISSYLAPFGLARHVAIHDDLLYTGDGAGFEIHLLDRAGDVVRIMRHSGVPAAVDGAAIDQYEATQLATATTDRQIQRWRQLFREWAYPDEQPAYDHLLVDADGNAWIRHFRIATTGMSQWSVLEPNGRWLGLVSLPADLDVKEIGVDYVLAVVTDEFGVEYVRLYSIERER
jgi:hypothetical protein